MRALVAGTTLVIVIGIAAAKGPTLAQNKPTGNLIQIMRGSVFRDANIIFDVQQADPGEPVKPNNGGEGTSTTARFSNVYSGWQVVENAAVMLDESVDLMLKSRLCANGIPAPVGQSDYRKSAEGLRTVARDILKAAQVKNRDQVIELAGSLSEACASCHQIYRDPEGPKGIWRHVNPLQGARGEGCRATMTRTGPSFDRSDRRSDKARGREWSVVSA